LCRPASDGRAQVGGGTPNFVVNNPEMIVEARATMEQQGAAVEADKAWAEGETMDDDALAALLEQDGPAGASERLLERPCDDAIVDVLLELEADPGSVVLAGGLVFDGRGADPVRIRDHDVEDGRALLAPLGGCASREHPFDRHL